MGRRSLTKEEREARGNPGKRNSEKKAAAAPKPQGAIKCPAFLKGAARKMFNSLADDLVSSNLLRTTEVNGFARWCQYMTDWIAVNKVMTERGEFTYETVSNHGTMERIVPQFNVRARLEVQLKALEEQIGMLPAARQRIMLGMAAGGWLPPDPNGKSKQDDLPLSGEKDEAGVPTVGALH